MNFRQVVRFSIRRFIIPDYPVVRVFMYYFLRKKYYTERAYVHVCSAYHILTVMPISDAYRVLFFHIPKTAGSTVEEVFDIQYVPHRARKDLLSWINTETIPAYQHLLPSTTRKLLEEDKRLDEVWDRYLKFTVVRNPYERAVSTYHSLKRNGRFSHATRTFFDFLRFARDVVKEIEENGSDSKYDTVPFLHHLRPQRHWFRSSENVYDVVLRFENLEQDLTDLFVAVTGSAPGKCIPRLNVTNRMEKPTWASFYHDLDSNAIECFEEAYGRDRDLGHIHYPIFDHGRDVN